MSQRIDPKQETSLTEPNTSQLEATDIQDIFFPQQISLPVAIQLNEQNLTKWLEWLDRDRERQFAFARFSKKLDLANYVLALLTIAFLALCFGLKESDKLTSIISILTPLIGFFGIKKYLEKTRSKSK